MVVLDVDDWRGEGVLGQAVLWVCAECGSFPRIVPVFICVSFGDFGWCLFGVLGAVG